MQVSQQQSERAIEQAQEAQRRASDQERRAAAAQAEVQDLQQRLAQAQERARLEQERAQQLQIEANQATERATAEARQSQEHAVRGLAQQSQQAQRGEQALSGQVLRAANDQLVIQPRGGGEPMTFLLTDRTRVEISGRQATGSDLMQGEDARVSYQVTGAAQPTAISVQVIRAEQQPPR